MTENEKRLIELGFKRNISTVLIEEWRNDKTVITLHFLTRDYDIKGTRTLELQGVVQKRLKEFLIA